MREQTLETWNFRIDGNEKILEIHYNHQEYTDKKQIKMIDTTGGHYGIILETRKRQDTSMFLVEDDSGILFV